MILNDATFQNAQNEYKNGPKTVLTFLESFHLRSCHKKLKNFTEN